MALGDIGLALAVVYGRNWARIVLMLSSVVAVAAGIIDNARHLDVITLETLPTVSMSILILLALSSHRARDYTAQHRHRHRARNSHVAGARQTLKPSRRGRANRLIHLWRQRRWCTYVPGLAYAHDAVIHQKPAAFGRPVHALPPMTTSLRRQADEPTSAGTELERTSPSAPDVDLPIHRRTSMNPMQQPMTRSSPPVRR